MTFRSGMGNTFVTAIGTSCLDNTRKKSSSILVIQTTGIFDADNLTLIIIAMLDPSVWLLLSSNPKPSSTPRIFFFILAHVRDSHGSHGF